MRVGKSIMGSKHLLQNIVQAFTKWNFFKSRKSKVHPTGEEGCLCPDDNSSDSGNEQAVGLWQDFIEEFDCLLEDTKGEKAEMYLLDNRPLIHEVVTGTGLFRITEEIIHTFGLQVLNIVLDVICDASVNGTTDTLEDVMKRMEQLDYSKWGGQKLFVWIEDFPSTDTDNCDLLCRLIITELMRRKIEPQMVIPCHDMDTRIMKTVKSIMHKDLKTTIPFTEDVLFDSTYEASMYLIALRIALASANCNIILIDTNQQFIDTPEFRGFTEFARNFGHEVMFVRHTPNTNKYWVVHDFANRVEEWVRAKSMYVDVSFDEDQLVVPRRGEILHKLTQSHFIREGEGTNNNDNDEALGEDDSSRGSETETDSQDEDSSGSEDEGESGDGEEGEDFETTDDEEGENSDLDGSSRNEDTADRISNDSEDPYGSEFDSDAS